jgi:hypothetical protein
MIKATCFRFSRMRAAIPGAWMVSTDDFPLLNDHVHYNADGQWRLGSAFAKTMLAAGGATERK